METHLFKEQMISSPFLGSFAGLIVWALPIGELFLALALSLPRFRLAALYITLGLMALFTIYVILIVSIDDHISCSCGGIIEELSPKQHILFNSVCVILCVLGITVRRRGSSSRSSTVLIGTLSIGLFLVVGWILFSAFSTASTIKTGMEGRLLPSFDLFLADSTTHFNTGNIPSGKPVIVIGFQPWCTHCQAETRDIIQHIEMFKDIRIYYVTNYPYSQMKIFYDYFKLFQYPNIIMGQDSTNTFLRYFHAPGVPYIAIFDAKKRLKEANGQISAERLAQIASK